MKAKQILIIDDELWTVESTIDRINRVFGDETVVYCDDVIDGLNKIIENEYACIILDVMFPLPDMGNEQNRAVLLKEFEPLHSVEMTPVNTGIVVLHNIRNVLDVTVPVICFTIRKDESLIEQISKYKKTIHIHKLDEKAFELLINELKKYR